MEIVEPLSRDEVPYDRNLVANDRLVYFDYNKKSEHWRLADSGSSIEQEQNEQMQSSLAEGSRLPFHRQRYFLSVERRKNQLGLFELWDFQGRAVRAPCSRPLQVGIDGPGGRIAAGSFEPFLTHPNDGVFQLLPGGRLGA